MTDPNIHLGEIVVRGQRRRDPSDSFPIGGGSSGPVNPPPITSETNGGGGGEVEILPDPCADPETALPWNADAAGADSPDEFRNAARSLGFADAPNGTPTLSNREFGRGLARGPNGSVVGNAVSWGPPIAPGDVGTFTLDYTGIDASNYLGDAHSHPNGNPLPSVADWNGFIINNNRARSAGRIDETYFMYIFAVSPDGSTGTMYVYEDGPRAAGSADPPRPTSVGPEVNPDAQAC